MKLLRAYRWLLPAILLLAPLLAGQSVSAVGSTPDLISVIELFSLTPGSNGTVVLNVHNIGDAASSGALNLAVTLPGGLTLGSSSGTGWLCSGTTTVSCGRSDGLIAGDGYPTLTLTVGVPGGLAAGVYQIDATVSGGGQPTNANDTSSRTFTVAGTGSVTVTTTADTDSAADGACSLREAIEAVNRAATYQNCALSGSEPYTIRFNVPVGQLTGGVARIVIAYQDPDIRLPDITRDGVIVDGTTQPGASAGPLGSGGVVGRLGSPLAQVQAPKVELVGGHNPARPTEDATTTGLKLFGKSITVKGMAIYGFRIGIDTISQFALIEGNLLGSGAAAFADPGPNSRTLLSSVQFYNSDNTVRNNLIGYSDGVGVRGIRGTQNLVTNNEIRANALLITFRDGVAFEDDAGTVTNAGSVLDGVYSTNIVRNNLITDNRGNGVDTFKMRRSAIIANNTITSNGSGGFGTDLSGVRLYTVGAQVVDNLISGNAGPGVQVMAASDFEADPPLASGASGNSIRRNLISANGQLPITLRTNGATEPQPLKLNDGALTATAGNGLQDFAVIQTATISGTGLLVKGFSRPGATVDVSAEAAGSAPFAEQRSYLGAGTEGSAADTDAGTGSYSGPVNGVDQGADPAAARFAFLIPVLPPGVVAGTTINATGTGPDGSTSQVGGPVTIGAPDLRITQTLRDFYIGSTSARVVIDVTNVGNAATVAPIQTVTTLPASVSYLGFSGSGWSCTAGGQVITCRNAGSAAAGASFPPLQLNISVPNAAGESRTVGTVLTGGGQSGAGQSTSTTVSVDYPIDLSFTALSALPVKPGEGQLVTFTTTIKNSLANASFPRTATNIVVSLGLPANLRLISATPPAGTSVSGGQWSIPSLAIDETRTISYVALVVRGGPTTVAPQVIASTQADINDPAGATRSISFNAAFRYWAPLIRTLR